VEDRLLNFVKRKFDEYRKGPRSAYYCGKIDALEEVLKEAEDIRRKLINAQDVRPDHS